MKTLPFSQIITGIKHIFTSEIPSETIFDYSPAAMWIEDFSSLKKGLTNLKKRGVKDLRTYLFDQPEEVFRLFASVRVRRVNPAAVSLLRASDEDELLGSLSVVINEETLPFLVEQLLAIDERRAHIEGETVNTTLDGRQINILVGITIPKAGKDLKNVVISMMDISSYKRYEREQSIYLSRLREQTAFSETMREITLALSRSTDTSRILDLILEHSNRIVPYRTANIRTIEGDELIVQRRKGYEAFGADTFITEFDEKVSRFQLVYDAIESGEPIVVNDTYKDERWIVFPETSYIRSIIILPIQAEGKSYGVLSVESDEADRYTKEEAEKLQPLAYAAAITFEKAELYEQLRSDLRNTEEDKARISDTLERKETLLKEVHHRIKNNLTLITSLINLKSTELEDTASEDVLEQLKRKILSISLIHEKLYRSVDLQHINFHEYSDDLLGSLGESLSAEKQVEIDNRIDESIVFLPEHAIPFGLILTELFTNSVKYAEPEEDFCRISLETQREEEMVYLSVRDNGKGFGEDFSLSSGESLGTQIIHNLSGQLGGKAEVGSRENAEIVISFPSEIVVSSSQEAESSGIPHK